MLGALESCQTIDELKEKLQAFVENYGFCSFSFTDIGHPDLDEPFTVMTNDLTWDATYRDYGFVHVDPVISVARRTNRPFHWGAVELPERKARRTPAALKTMDAARDHGFNEGLVIPLHFTDALGRLNSASGGFFWTEKESDFLSTFKCKKHDMHLLMLYWAQKISSVAEHELNRRRRFVNEDGGVLAYDALTDREKDVLSWAARGKTMSETATILTISDATVETHLKNVMRKLFADNKTHAVAKAIYLGLIDI